MILHELVYFAVFIKYKRRCKETHFCTLIEIFIHHKKTNNNLKKLS